MAVKCIDNKTEYELININTSDSNVNDIANKYIQDRHINVKQSVGYNNLLLYISHNVEFYSINNKNNNPDYTDILKLDYYFMIFTEICCICCMLPSIQNFCVFTGIPYYTMKDWGDGTNRSYTHTPVVKKWKEFCQACCVSEAATGNVGAIYISKALYGMSDTPSPNTYIQNNTYLNAPPPAGTITEKYLDMIPAKKEPLNLPDA